MTSKLSLMTRPSLMIKGSQLSDLSFKKSLRPMLTESRLRKSSGSKNTSRRERPSRIQSSDLIARTPKWRRSFVYSRRATRGSTLRKRGKMLNMRKKSMSTKNKFRIWIPLPERLTTMEMPKLRV